MNWKEELEKVSYDIDDEDLKNEPVIAYSDAVQIVKQAIQTRERELREEWQKLETISKEVEIDNLAMQYELGREDREREISEEVELFRNNEIDQVIPECDCVGIQTAFCTGQTHKKVLNPYVEYVFRKTLSIINNKSL